MKPILIDGSYGEGGGQILRSSLTLAAVLSKPVEIINIRAGRKKPGLQTQHLTGVRAVAEITDGKLEGDELQSTRIKFEPGKIRHGKFEFDVMKVKASAGSTGMIFQQVAPVLAFAQGGSHIVLKGGTHTAWAPPIDYLSSVFLPTIAQMGFHAELKTEVWGWYPIGQGRVIGAIHAIKDTLKGINLTERGELKKITGVSILSNLPPHIGEREIKQANDRLKDHKLEAEIEIVQAPSKGTGNFFFLLAEYENTLAGFSALGERGKRAEVVANEAVDEFLKHHQSQMAIEKHLADQLILYMALAEGKSSFTTSEISNHVITNLWVMEQFLPVKVEVKGKLGEPGEVSINGVGYKPF
jgi:RNA 3'-terminal phosphate cyclase (ATP)